MEIEKFLHDARNSLTIIKGNLDLIKNSNKFLEEAKSEVNHLKEMMDSVEEPEN